MTEIYKLDCTGLVCPQPVAKTKRMINNMNSGDILEVSGDFAEAGENIRRFVEKNDGKVLEFKIEGDSYFLKIQKK
ncbi:MAG: sulfurtransferase TusA family protein [Promethearchaeota archaeon]